MMKFWDRELLQFGIFGLSEWDESGFEEKRMMTSVKTLVGSVLSNRITEHLDVSSPVAFVAILYTMKNINDPIICW